MGKISPLMGVGALVSIPGSALRLYKTWAVANLGPQWEHHTVLGRVLEMHDPPEGKKTPNAKIGLLPVPNAPEGPTQCIIINLNGVRLIKPTEAAVAAAAEAGEAAGGVAVEAQPVPDNIEAERMEEEVMVQMVEDEVLLEQDPPANVTVHWGDWVPFEDVRERSRHDFELPHAHFNGNTTPLDVFKYFFPPTLAANIIAATNQTGPRQRQHHLPYHRDWTPLDENEFYLFLGYWLAMGVHVSNRSEHWSEAFEHPIFSGIEFGQYGISRDRFADLVSALSFVPDVASEVDGVDMVRTMQDTFNEHMVHQYSPSWLINTDESMTPW